MNRFQERLAVLCGELGVTVNFDFAVVLPSGKRIVSPTYFPDFGAERGTLVFDWSTDVRDMSEEIKSEGYTFSTMSVFENDGRGDLDVWAEVLADWGWTGNDNIRPAWLDSITRSILRDQEL